MSWRILTAAIEHESDVVSVRQWAKRLAELLGLDPQDQDRLAAAVSEIAGNAFSYARKGIAEFYVDEAPPSALMVRVRDNGHGIAGLEAILESRPRASTAVGFGITAARHLVDRFSITSTAEKGTSVELGKLLPSTGAAVTRADIAAISATLQREQIRGPLAALRDQSRELLRSLNEGGERQEELIRLNKQLDDTNCGVVALYTELDVRAEQLRKASDLKTRFLSNISHEFRTPLNSILGLSRLLLDKVDGDLTPEQEKQVKYIRRATESLVELVNDLLDLAKVEAGRTDVKSAFFSASDLFSGLRGALGPLLVNDAVELVFEDVSDIPPFYTDEAKVAQILRNFISNAIKFTPRGEVRVAAQADKASDRVVMIVKDTGIGIAAEDQERIFEEFAQVQGPMQVGAQGTGLGLPLSRRLAALLGGTVTVDSAPGIGSTFFLTIPRCYRPPVAPEPSSPTPPPKTVLLIDDDEEIRYIMRQIMSKDPLLRIVEAANGREGLAMVRNDRPDLIVLDLQMPVLDGFAVLSALAADGATADIPVVVLTSLHLSPENQLRLSTATAIVEKERIAKEDTLAVIRDCLHVTR